MQFFLFHYIILIENNEVVIDVINNFLHGWNNFFFNGILKQLLFKNIEKCVSKTHVAI